MIGTSRIARSLARAALRHAPIAGWPAGTAHTVDSHAFSRMSRIKPLTSSGTSGGVLSQALAG